MDNTYLPNGSIVLLEGGNKKLMIYGRKQLLIDDGQLEKNEAEATMYDYLGVPYPEGYINQEYTYVFHHSDISEVIFEGYANEEEEEFQEVLKKA